MSETRGTTVGMCGRYVSVAERADLIELYNATAEEESPPLRPSWNVAPTQQVYGVLERPAKDGDRPRRQLRALRWGLVPSWAKDITIGSRLINARVETLASKPAFRRAFARRRVVLPAAGYYEWQPVEDEDGKVRKQPFYIHPADEGDVLSLAGLYELWPDPAKAEDDPDRWLWTAVIITTDATGPLGEVHDRTPLILPADRVDAWLDPQLSDPKRIQSLLAGIEIDNLAMRPVSRDVNKVGNNDPHLIEPLAAADEQPVPLALAS